MEIRRSGSQPSGKGPTDWFTGAVRIDPLLTPVPPARVEGLAVTFESGARTAWHTHPLGQMLIVTFGRGLAQREGFISKRRHSSQLRFCTSMAAGPRAAAEEERNVARPPPD
jgi:hypothetical protein